ncbi:CpsD/CapB family tyrosine-protein kinase [Aerococcaceae bacterium DSM 111176]|nr:CpsD/CapB family tyrosine-protein kinase [Aerococcaceae bacterium DSM 111176]
MALFGNNRKGLEKKFTKDQALGAPLVSVFRQNSIQSEQFKSIRTNIEFAQFDKSVKSFIVTSSIPAEGKSTVSSNLALTMAKTGKNVLLVDADLRKPTVNRTFNMDNEFGLTTLLMDEEADTSRVIKRISDFNLYVLPSGPTPPNPPELLGSAKMSHLINTFEENFDVIIYDVPPMNTVSDAQIMASRVGEVVVVARQGYVKKEELKRNISAIEKIDANIIGFIMNDQPLDNFDEYGYGYVYQ